MTPDTFPEDTDDIEAVLDILQDAFATAKDRYGTEAAVMGLSAFNEAVLLALAGFEEVTLQ